MVVKRTFRSVAKCFSLSSNWFSRSAKKLCQDCQVRVLKMYFWNENLMIYLKFGNKYQVCQILKKDIYPFITGVCDWKSKNFNCRNRSWSFKRGTNQTFSIKNPLQNIYFSTFNTVTDPNSFNWCVKTITWKNTFEIGNLDKIKFSLPLWLFDFRRYYEYGNVFENGLRSDRV